MDEEKKDIPVEDGKDKKNRKIEKLKEEIEKLEADVNHWKNEYYRAYADTQNLRKSLEKDHQEAMKYRSEGFLDELLPILDSFYVVLKNEPEDPALCCCSRPVRFRTRNSEYKCSCLFRQSRRCHSHH